MTRWWAEWRWRRSCRYTPAWRKWMLRRQYRRVVGERRADRPARPRERRQGSDGMKAHDVRVGDDIRDGLVMHVEPLSDRMRFTVREDTFPFSREHPSYRWVDYPPLLDVQPRKTP